MTFSEIVKRVAAILTLPILLAIAAWLWFSPFGTGEYASSPDGQYIAHATNIRRGTFLHGRIDLVEIRLENSKGKAIWVTERFPQPGESPPDFGNRSKQFIKWSADSKSFAVPVGAASDTVWNVP